IEGPAEGEEDDSAVLFNPTAEDLGTEIDRKPHAFALLPGMRYLIVARVPGLGAQETLPRVAVSFLPNGVRVVAASSQSFNDLPNWIETPVVLPEGGRGGVVRLYSPPGVTISGGLTMDWFTCIPVSGNYIENGSFESLERRPNGWFVHKLPGLE